MAGIFKKVGPAFVAASATDILAPPANTKAIVRHIHVTNKDTSARTFTLYVGATGGSASGTELVKDYSLAIAGASTSSWDYYGMLSLTGGTDYLSGIASTVSTCVVTVEYELIAV